MRNVFRLRTYERPRGARGILPLIAAAVASGGLRAGIGAIQNRSETRRSRNLINDSYADASRRLLVNQADVRQSTNESLNARGVGGSSARPTIAGTYGLLGGGETGRNPTTIAGTQVGPEAHTLGEQTQANTDQQLGFERKALDFEHDRANADNDANSMANSIGAISSGIQTGASVYNAGSMLGSGAGAAATPSMTVAGSPGDPGMPSTPSIASAYGHPSQHAFGVDAVDPLGHPQSAWASRGTINGTAAVSNADFHVG